MVERRVSRGYRSRPTGSSLLATASACLQIRPGRLTYYCEYLIRLNLLIFYAWCALVIKPTCIPLNARRSICTIARAYINFNTITLLLWTSMALFTPEFIISELVWLENALMWSHTVMAAARPKLWGEYQVRYGHVSYDAPSVVGSTSSIPNTSALP